VESWLCAAHIPARIPQTSWATNLTKAIGVALASPRRTPSWGAAYHNSLFDFSIAKHLYQNQKKRRGV